MYALVLIHVHNVHEGACDGGWKVLGLPGGVTGGCESPYVGAWELNSGSLPEQCL